MISLNYRDPRPIYLQVKEKFRDLIVSGVLAPDEKMPSVREIAGQLAINPNTIQRAYRELEAEGYIASVQGKGSYVCAKDETVRMRINELKAELGQLAAELRGLGVPGEELAELVKGGRDE